MKDNSHKTAISRNSPSAPMRYLVSEGVLVGDTLDYGCGRGKDAEYYNMDAYDPYYAPEKPTKLYDTITCIYVLNVLSKKNYSEVISDIKSYLKPSGKIYICVRRDIKQEGFTSKGTFQSLVELDYPIFYSNSNYCIYHI